jgi:catechol 2,3-dioxygenase-like lactoylglutathione lyase family enzyme
VLRVADLERAMAFYRDRLGFAVEFVYAGFYAGLRRDGCHIHLNCGQPLPRDQARLEREDHIDITVTLRDAAAFAASLDAAGIVPLVALREMPYGREIYVRDPDGWIIAFVEPTAPAAQ